MHKKIRNNIKQCCSHLSLFPVEVVGQAVPALGRLLDAVLLEENVEGMAGQEAAAGLTMAVKQAVNARMVGMHAVRVESFHRRTFFVLCVLSFCVCVTRQACAAGLRRVLLNIHFAGLRSVEKGTRRTDLPAAFCSAGGAVLRAVVRQCWGANGAAASCCRNAAQRSHAAAVLSQSTYDTSLCFVCIYMHRLRCTRSMACYSDLSATPQGCRRWASRPCCTPWWLAWAWSACGPCTAGSCSCTT